MRSPKRLAVEFENRNVIPDGSEVYEPFFGPGNAPVFLPADEFEDQPRPFPSTDPFHENSNLIESSRTDRLARELVARQGHFSAGAVPGRVDRGR